MVAPITVGIIPWAPAGAGPVVDAHRTIAAAAAA
jgi:hypothetical protein